MNSSNTLTPTTHIDTIAPTDHHGDGEYRAIFGSPTEINTSLQRDQGLVLNGSQQQVKLRCCSTSESDVWAFVVFPVGGSLSDPHMKAVNTKTARAIQKHMRSQHLNDPSKGVQTAKARSGLNVVKKIDTVVVPQVQRTLPTVTSMPTVVQAVPVVRVPVSVQLEAEKYIAAVSTVSVPPVQATIIASSVVQASIVSRSAADLSSANLSTAVPVAESVQNLFPVTNSSYALSEPDEIDFGALRNKLQLPCLIEITFKHPTFGDHRVVAELLWSDVTFAEPVSDTVLEIYHTERDNVEVANPDAGHDRTLFPVCTEWMGPTRMCFLHQILQVEPRNSPLALYRDQVFSSFTASTRQLQINTTRTNGFSKWHLLNEPKWTMAKVITHRGLINIHLETCEKSATLRNRMHLIRGEGERSRKKLDKNLLCIGSLAVIHVDNPSFARFVKPYGDNDSRNGYVGQLPTNPEFKRIVGLWNAISTNELTLEMDPPHVQKDYRERYRRTSARLAERIRTRQISDICFRDALTALCFFECRDTTCASAKRPAGSNAEMESPSEEDQRAVAQFTCEHGLTHNPFRNNEADEGVRIILEDGSKITNFSVFAVPKNVPRSAHDESIGALDEEHVFSGGKWNKTKSKRKQSDQNGNAKKRTRVGRAKSDCASFDPRKATPHDNRIKLQSYDPMNMMDEMNLPLIQLAVKTMLNTLRTGVSNTDILKPERKLDPMHFTREEMDICIDDAWSMNTADFYYQQRDAQTHIESVADWQAMERYWKLDCSPGLGRFVTYCDSNLLQPKPEPWILVSWVLKDRTHVPSNRKQKLQSINMLVSSDVHRVIFPSEYQSENATK